MSEKLAAGVVVRAKDTGAVLQLLRSDGKGWGVPGGKVEPGEEPTAAAVRELREETGVEVEPASLRELGRFPGVDGYTFVAYLAEVPQAMDVQIDTSEGSGYAWQREPVQPVFASNGAVLTAASAVPVGDRAETDANGWVTYKDNPLSQEGVFPYLGKTLIAAGYADLDPDKLYPVYRPASELNNQATIDSFKLVPWIVGHTHLGTQGANVENVGLGGVVGENVYFKDGTLYGTLKVFGGNLRRAIDADVKELSIGYSCSFERSSGTFKGETYEFIQRGIMGNHLASVPNGRCGPAVRVQDSIDCQKVETMDEELKARIDTLEKGHADILALLQELKAAKEGDNEDPNKPKTGDNEDPNKPKTGDNEPPKAKEGDNEPPKPKEGDTEEKIEAMVGDAMPKVLRALAQRDSLARELQPLIGVFDHAEMTLGQVASYGVKKLGVSIAPTPEALTAYLAGRKATAAPATHVGDTKDNSGATPAFLKNLIGA